MFEKFFPVFLHTMKAEKIFINITFVVFFLLSSHLIEALHKDCADHFEGFSLPDSYNPNIPPNSSRNDDQVENFTIKDYIFVKEITKVAIPYNINVLIKGKM
jgi:hypothetical protein